MQHGTSDPHPQVLGRSPVELGAQGVADDHRTTSAAHGAVVAQRCDRCRACFFPPLLGCSGCRSSDLSWIDCGETGTVGTFVTVHGNLVTPSMGIPKWLVDRMPYTSVYVVPDAVPTLRIPALMEGPQQADIRVGSSVCFDTSDPRSLGAHLLE